MSVIYLDIDDEITSAAARIRAAPEGSVALVLPSGSRVATSRINFRLLAREAQARDRRLAIIAPEASTRALASAAGLPVFSSVLEYEASSTGPPPDPGPGASPAAAAAAGPALGVAAATAGVVGGPTEITATAATETARTPGAPDSVRDDPRPREGPGRTVEREPGGSGGSAAAPAPIPAGIGARAGSRRRRVVLVVVAVAVLLAGAAVGAAAYIVLPTATVVLVPTVQPVGPESFTVRADPAATAVDPVTSEIPATRLTFTADASGTFPATGRKVAETRARGTVVFQNCDTSGSRTIRAGTLLRTRDGIGFTTTAQVTLPVAAVPSPGQITCPSRSVDVVAARPGVAGNVAARTITVLPSSLDSNVLFVRNPSPTSGGTRTETTVVSQADVDEARAALDRDLADRFAELSADPGAAPPGSTVYPETADLGDPTYSDDPDKLVGTETATFELAARATGEVTAVDPSPIQGIADERIAAAVTVGHTLVPDSTVVHVADGVAEGPVVTFAVDAAAREVRDIDVAAVRDAIRGRSIQDAREILADYGTATIVVWPDWATAITGLDARLEVTVETPTSSSPPGITPSPTSGSPAPPAGSPTDQDSGTEEPSP